MSEIRANIDFSYYPSASEECRTVLFSLGYELFCIIPHVGSHHADIYFFRSDEDKFKNELLGNTVIGKYRRFYFSNSYSSLGCKEPYYNIGYSKLNN
jgi:hypothetical protein